MDIRVNMHDASTKAKTSKTITNTDQSTLAKLESIQSKGGIVSEFDKKEQIHWNWIIDEVEILNS